MLTSLRKRLSRQGNSGPPQRGQRRDSGRPGALVVPNQGKASTGNTDNDSEDTAMAGTDQNRIVPQAAPEPSGEEQMPAKPRRSRR